MVTIIFSVLTTFKNCLSFIQLCTMKSGNILEIMQDTDVVIYTDR